MNYAHLFDGKTWQIRQKVLRHVLVSDVGKERFLLNIFLFSLYHILAQGKYG